MQKGSRLLTYINARLRVTIQQECVAVRPDPCALAPLHSTHSHPCTHSPLSPLRSRIMEGVFLAFDRHMNIVLGDAEEYRTVRVKKAGGGGMEDKEEKRALGLVLVRGTNVVSVQVVKAAASMKQAAGAAGAGAARAAGRGTLAAAAGAGAGQQQAAPLGLAGGPMRGLGGPAPSHMAPPPGFMPGMMPGMMPPPGFPPGYMPPPGR